MTKQLSPMGETCDGAVPIMPVAPAIWPYPNTNRTTRCWMQQKEFQMKSKLAIAVAAGLVGVAGFSSTAAAATANTPMYENDFASGTGDWDGSALTSTGGA